MIPRCFSGNRLGAVRAETQAMPGGVNATDPTQPNRSSNNRPTRDAVKEESIMIKAKKFSILERAVIAFMMAWCSLTATAGTKGAFVNTFGFGVAVESVVYFGVSNTASSVSMQNPCAGVNHQTNLGCIATHAGELAPGTP